MNGKRSREARYQRVISALPDAERMLAEAEYIVARLVGKPARPPDHWTPEMIADWAQVLSTAHVPPRTREWHAYYARSVMASTCICSNVTSAGQRKGANLVAPG